MPFTSTDPRKQGGFTLVEVAVVVPMIVIIVIGILALLITLVRNNVVQISRNNQVYQTRLALASVEKDVSSSTLFFPSTLPGATFSDFNAPGLSGTYKTNGTLSGGSSSSNLNALFLQAYNQILDPQDATKTKVTAAFKGTPPCSGSAITQTSNIAPIAVLYFVTNGTLYKRTLVDKTNPTTCGTKLIKQSCPTGSDANTPVCSVKDVALLSGVTQFKVDYYLNANDTVVMDAYIGSPSPTIDQAKAIAVTITSATTASGASVSHTATLRMAKSQ